MDKLANKIKEIAEIEKSKYLAENSSIQTNKKGGYNKMKSLRKTNKKIKLGICGEHGGDPKSIHFCSKVGLDYVSCSPYRVPIARLAAAQAEIAKVAVEKYKGKFLIRGGKKITTEGEESPRTVVIEFPTFEETEKFFYSREYQEAHSILEGAVVRHHQIIEGKSLFEKMNVHPL